MSKSSTSYDGVLKLSVSNYLSAENVGLLNLVSIRKIIELKLHLCVLKTYLQWTMDCEHSK